MTMTSNGTEKSLMLCDLYRSLVADHEAKGREWIEQMRSMGVKGAHPDDGWVDRENNAVTLAYPQFQDSIEAGDLFALGNYRKYRIVRVVGFDRQKCFYLKFYFEDRSNG